MKFTLAFIKEHTYEIVLSILLLIFVLSDLTDVNIIKDYFGLTSESMYVTGLIMIVLSMLNLTNKVNYLDEKVSSKNHDLDYLVKLTDNKTKILDDVELGAYLEHFKNDILLINPFPGDDLARKLLSENMAKSLRNDDITKLTILMFDDAIYFENSLQTLYDIFNEFGLEDAEKEKVTIVFVKDRHPEDTEEHQKVDRPPLTVILGTHKYNEYGQVRMRDEGLIFVHDQYFFNYKNSSINGWVISTQNESVLSEMKDYAIDEIPTCNYGSQLTHTNSMSVKELLLINKEDFQDFKKYVKKNGHINREEIKGLTKATDCDTAGEKEDK